MAKNKRFIATSVTAALVATALAPVASATFQINDYKDYASIASWAQEAVDFVTNQGIMKGYDNKFSPERSLTRGEAAKIIAMSLGLANSSDQLDKNVELSFTDTKGHWSAPYIKLLQDYDKDIIRGYTDGTFKPDQLIRRDELAKIVVTAKKLEANEQVKVQFKDGDNWAKEYIYTLASHGIVIGSGNGKFNPASQVDRQSSAVYIHRLLVEDKRIPAEKNPSVIEIIPTQNEDQKQAEKVTELIAELPAMKDILTSGAQILETQKAFDALTEKAQALVSEESKKNLSETTKNYISFTKSDISGLNVKVAMENDIAKKQALVDTAKANLEIAQELGLKADEIEFYANQVAEAQKQVDRAVQQATDKANKEAAAKVTTMISNLPEMKDILASGAQILETQKAFDALPEKAQALVSEQSKQKLAETVKNYISFTKSDISGLNVKVAMENDIAKKQALVDAANDKLNVAKELGFAGGEYDQSATQIAEAQKQVDRAVQQATDKANKEAAAKVTTMISNLPEMKDILASGAQILETQKAFDALTEKAQALVSEVSKQKLAETVKNYISFTKSDISGLNTKVAMENDIAKKQALVDAANDKLNVAKELGFAGGEYDQSATQIAEAQKQVDRAVQQATDKANKEAAAKVTTMISNLPEMKDILENGAQILETQKAFDALPEKAQALVSEESKKSLKETVTNFISFTKADISGLNAKVAMESDKAQKKALVEAAKEKLNFAKELGLTGSEYDFYANQVAAAQKQVASKTLAQALTVESVNDGLVTVTFSENVPVSILSTVDAPIAEKRINDKMIVTISQEAFTNVITIFNEMN